MHWMRADPFAMTPAQRRVFARQRARQKKRDQPDGSSARSAWPRRFFAMSKRGREEEDKVRFEVSTYYGETLSTTGDLKTNACCTGAAPPAHIRKALSKVHR